MGLAAAVHCRLLDPRVPAAPDVAGHDEYVLSGYDLGGDTLAKDVAVESGTHRPRVFVYSVVVVQQRDGLPFCYGRAKLDQGLVVTGPRSRNVALAVDGLDYLLITRRVMVGRRYLAGELAVHDGPRRRFPAGRT